MDSTEIEKIHYYSMAAESNLQLSAADKELLIKSIEKEFPRNPLPKQIVPDDFIDYCDDVSFLELYEDWKSIPYYELWYERTCGQKLGLTINAEISNCGHSSKRRLRNSLNNMAGGQKTGLTSM